MIINYRNGTHHSSLTSHYVRTGQIPSTSVHVSTATMADFTNDVHRPRLTSPPSVRFSLRLIRLFLAPRYAAVYTALHPDVFHKRTAVGRSVTKFKFSEPSASHMPSMASRLRRLKTCKR